MRKYLEQEMIADSLRGKVRYNCTTFIGMDGCRFFELFVDGKSFKRFSWETVNSYFIAEGYVNKPKPMRIADYWKDFWRVLEKYPMTERTEYTDDEFCAALEEYRNSNIQESIHSQNPIVKMFALFDRRIGKRTLEQIEEEVNAQPKWVQALYQRRKESSFSAKISIPGREKQ